MTTIRRGRKRRYDEDEISDIILSQEVSKEDFTFLCALSNHAMVVENPQTGRGSLAGLKSVDIVVIQSDAHATGYFYEVGHQPVIVINEEASILDYDLISDLHPMHDWDIYLWLSHPWSAPNTPLGIHGEWVRREVYPDGMVAFNNEVRGWEDLPPFTDEEDTDDDS